MQNLPPPQTGSVTIDHRSPIEALRDPPADLLVLGSRGLHGPRALGSVSERVAHDSPASILVVRTTEEPTAPTQMNSPHRE